MVVFTCQHCGDPVKKPAVEKHYYTKCRLKSPHLTCVDCLKDFSGEDYGSHNQCMTEAQRYSSQGTVFKEQKGKKKQEQFIEMIQKILSSQDLTLSPIQRSLLEVCSNHDNVPRKPKPFQNFIKNVARSVYCKEKDIEVVFQIIENAWKKETQSKSSLEKGKETTNIQEEPKNNGEALNKTDKEINNDETKSDEFKKSKKKKLSDKCSILDYGLDSTTTEKTVNGDNKEFTNDKNDLKPKKTKKKIQNENYLSMDDVDEGNEMSLAENFKKVNEDMFNSESKKSKKEKQKRNALCLDNEDVANLEMENGSKYNIDLKDAIIDDIKENVNKDSKKQLRKKKKYEKYLAELENETKFEVNQNPINAVGEESDESKINRMKKKKLKAKEDELESVGLTEAKNAVNTKNLTMKADIKKNKKRKREECVGETPEKKIKENLEEGIEESAVAVFNWGDVIMRVLDSRPDKELSLKKLGKKVVNEYQAVKQDHRTYEELLAKFNKKVNKVKGVRVLRDRAKLIE